MPTTIDTRAAFRGRNIVSMRDLSVEDIMTILDYAAELKSKPQTQLLAGKLMASCFFEPSTRTRLSFESAMHRLGGQVIGFSEAASTSASKGETLSDGMRVIGEYADAIVLRHPLEGAAREAAEATNTPVINGGDGANQHPTQTLLDLFTIREHHGRLENLSIAFVGDLKYGRTVHSLVQASAHFGVRMFFVGPKSLTLPQELIDDLKMRSILFSFHNTLDEVVGKADVLYMTRLQRERLSEDIDERLLQHQFTLTADHLAAAQEALCVMHPLPRVWEIAPEIDKTPHALYFKQAANGVPVRQAILSLVLGIV